MTIKQKHVADTSFFDILNDYEIESVVEDPMTSLDLLDSILGASVESDTSNDSKIIDGPQHIIMGAGEEKLENSVKSITIDTSKELEKAITHSNLNFSEKDKFLSLAIKRMNMDLREDPESKSYIKLREKTKSMTATDQAPINIIKSPSGRDAKVILREFLETIDAHIKRLNSVEDGQYNTDSYNATFLKKVDALHKIIVDAHEGNDVDIDENVTKVDLFIKSFLAKANQRVLSVKQLSRVSAHLQSLVRPKILCKYNYWTCKLCRKKQIPFERMKCPVCGRPKSSKTCDADPKPKQMNESVKHFLSIKKNESEDNVDKKQRDYYLFKKNDLDLGLRTSLVEDAHDVLETLKSTHYETKIY
ncbi:predicted protein [Chaetoceros tenuissimus]|uniref:Uncharacterized protein n=1 Tax=Chaetoceros tenuissimus TaxID=426638 RepID=A0AAD3H2S1_9STRA|nr:predicted protein [Chaetoceros tenuissimus]